MADPIDFGALVPDERASFQPSVEVESAFALSAIAYEAERARHATDGRAQTIRTIELDLRDLVLVIHTKSEKYKLRVSASHLRCDDDEGRDQAAALLSQPTVPSGKDATGVAVAAWAGVVAAALLTRRKDGRPEAQSADDI